MKKALRPGPSAVSLAPVFTAPHCDTILAPDVHAAAARALPPVRSTA